MCFSIPAKVIKVIDEESAYAVRKNKELKINTALIGKLSVNDWILTNANLAISKITSQEAKTINNYFNNNV